VVGTRAEGVLIWWGGVWGPFAIKWRASGWEARKWTRGQGLFTGMAMVLSGPSQWETVPGS
jgi:hypothetical protein